MKEKYKMSWDEFFSMCKRLAIQIKDSGKQYEFLYPIMKNGLPVAERLSKYLNMDISYRSPILNCLIVDDIVDSGNTINQNQFENKDKAVLFVREGRETDVNYFCKILDEWIIFPWEKEDVDIYNNITRILEYIGEDPNREGLLETPKRIVNSWKELFSGYNQNPKELIKVFEDGACDEMIILKDVEFYSTCEHHMLPFFGKIHIGYIPNGKVIGVSKIARLIEVYARRLQIQERMTSQIADFLFSELQAKGVMVKTEAIHFCMTARGVQKQNNKLITSAIRGIFEEQRVREEFLNLIK